MPRGVPSRVQVAGKESRSYSLTEIANGTGLSLALVCKIFNGKLPLTSYSAPRLAEFLGITIEELSTPGTIVMATPPVRPLGRVVGRVLPGSTYRPPSTAAPLDEAQLDAEFGPVPPCPRSEPSSTNMKNG